MIKFLSNWLHRPVAVVLPTICGYLAPRVARRSVVGGFHSTQKVARRSVVETFPRASTKIREASLLSNGYCAVTLLLCGLGAAGCSREKLEQLAADATAATKQAVSSVAPKVERMVSNAPDGQASFECNASVQCDATFGDLLILGEGRPNVLRIRSYESEAEESFPAFLFQGTVPVENWSQLLGQTVAGQLYVQATKDSLPCSTAAGNQVELQIGQIEGGELVAEIVAGQLVDAAGALYPVKGKLRIYSAKLADVSSNTGAQP